jgi:hypothetical protein
MYACGGVSGRNDHKQSEVPEGETFVQIAAGQV